MKETLRKNGLKMFTVRIDFHIARDHICEALYEKALDRDELPKSRAAVFKLVKQLAHANGAFLTYQSRTEEDLGWTEAEQKAARETAEALVDKLFPELKT